MEAAGGLAGSILTVAPGQVWFVIQVQILLQVILYFQGIQTEAPVHLHPQVQSPVS